MACRHSARTLTAPVPRITEREEERGPSWALSKPQMWRYVGWGKLQRPSIPPSLSVLTKTGAWHERRAQQCKPKHLISSLLINPHGNRCGETTVRWNAASLLLWPALVFLLRGVVPPGSYQQADGQLSISSAQQCAYDRRGRFRDPPHTAFK